MFAGAIRRAEYILLLHDGDPIGLAVARLIRERGLPVRELVGPAPTDEIVGAAFGSHAIIAVGDHFASQPAVHGAAQMPGVGALVVVVRRNPDLTTLRRKGIPYTVLRVGVLLEDVLAALWPEIARGRLVLAADGDALVHAVSADDAAACALTATREESVCGRVMTLSAPTPLSLSEIATRAANATGRRLTVSHWPRWAIAALRAVRGAPFVLPDEMETQFLEADLSALHPGPWQTPESVALNVERRNEHAMGM